MADAAQVEQIYESMSAVFAPLDTWSFFVLTSYASFEKRLRKRATRLRKLFNGKLECTYYQMLGPKPAALHRRRQDETVRP